MQLPRRTSLDQLGRSLEWMVDESCHRGEQATAIARTTLRRLHNSRIEFDTLLQKAEDFREACRSPVYRKIPLRPRPPGIVLALPNTGAVATRIVSRVELRRMGRELGNFLQGSFVQEHYARRLRNNSLEFWRIDVGQDTGAPIIALTLDAEYGDITRIEHVNGPGAFIRDGKIVVTFLEVRRNTRELPPHRATGRDQLAEYGAVIDPIPMSDAIGSVTARFAEASWSFVAAEGAMLARPGGAAIGALGSGQLYGWILQDWRVRRNALDYRLLRWFEPIEAKTQRHFPEDFGVNSYEAFLYRWESDIRTALRRACREDPGLAELCYRAFGKSRSVFCEDWFGTEISEGRQ